MRRVHVGAALDYVFGYTVCNAPRATFSSESQWTRGKSFDTFCPLGPVVVTADELRAFCSRTFTLEPGDLLLTGTPWGCGYFMDPPRALELGDVVECEVERIGVLRNAVAEAR